MKHSCRLGLGILIILAALRAVFFLLYCVDRVGFPIEVHPLESAQVHLSWRVQTGQSLYPSWESYPHISNFFAPIYYWWTGGLGRLIDADLEGLFFLGRVTTVSVNFLTLLTIGVFLRRRYCTSAAVLGIVMGLGTSPLYGFAVMVRPDVMADFLGLAGFLLVAGSHPRAIVLGGMLLVFSGLTKQTAFSYLFASVIACWLVPTLRRFRWMLVGECLALLSVFVLALQHFEPNSLESLLGEGKTAFSLRQSFRVFEHLMRTSPDLVFFGMAGIAAWITSKETDLAVLAIVTLVISFVSSAKTGSDLNYSLGLRAVEVLAFGKLWHSALADHRLPAYVLTLGALILLPSLGHARDQFSQTRRAISYWKTEEGQENLRAYRRVLAIAEDPDLEILTDSGIVALQQRGRAPFVDPWLFRMLVHTGRIDPIVMAERVRSKDYDLLILTSELYTSPVPYERYEFGLPVVLARAAKGRYQLIGHQAGFFVYRPWPRGKPRQ